MKTNPVHMTNTDGEEQARPFVVIHPLDDAAETKVRTSGMGPMRMTLSVKISLMALRGYLLLMMMLLLYHILDLAGLFGHWK